MPKVHARILVDNKVIREYEMVISDDTTKGALQLINWEDEMKEELFKVEYKVVKNEDMAEQADAQR